MQRRDHKRTGGRGDHRQRPVDAESPCAPSGTGVARANETQHLDAKDFNPSLFESAVRVSNGFYPLRPGTRLFYRGSSLEEGERLHQALLH